MAETTKTMGGASIQMEPLATKSDITRLEAKIDRLLALIEPVYRIEFIDGSPVMVLDESYIAAALLADRKAKP